MKAQSNNLDVLIVGGGVVGCLLARALATSGLKLGMVESRLYEAQQNHPGFDSRTLALARHSAHYLWQLGLKPQLKAASTPILSIKITDQGHLGQCYLDSHSQGIEALGYVISQQQLGNMLYSQLANQRLEWFCPDQVVKVQLQSDLVQVSLASGQQLATRLLVVADGGDSATAKMLGVNSQIDDYGQVALVANVQTEQPHHQRAFERFTQHGPLALLPIDKCQAGLVWSLNAASQDEFSRLSDAQLLSLLQQAFGYDLGRFTRISQRVIYPLRLVRAERGSAHRTVILGNAAHTLHPIAGQGFNLGLRDVQQLAAQLNQLKGEDPGGFKLLQHYQQQRQPDQLKVIGLTDGLVRLFSNQHAPLVVGRNMGLSLLQGCQGVKNLLAWQAMGYNGAN
ncbi:2-octaprenyl-6-methoxyphenyl hydroxylase [Bowmanella pacifica]|uniref:2-octaprenyl-6-methoxyphenyl hydroxylase n=1 Tax=Bowmanella pacifica TaxID=502051 RepID=A0A918DFL1_9ALTE|nr:2-octaprenyl-6-methoxyphenyl hydroxylase [Bowmanella pacifica]GGO64057.1 2-octaprenyl-6-methoxyphenyl hydroxylase [Bowmanella pacifica]